MFSLYSFNKPAGTLTSKGYKSRYLCILSVEEAQCIMKSTNGEKLSWLLYVPDDLVRGSILYVYIPSRFPYCPRVSSDRIGDDDIVLTRTTNIDENGISEIV